MKKTYFLRACIGALGFFTLTSAEAQSGASLNFDGIDDRINIPHSGVFNITNAITIEAWVNTVYNSEQYITSKNEDSWFLAQDGGQNTNGKASVFFNGLSPSGWLIGNISINDGNWHHVAATYDGSSVKLYVDGALDAQAAKSGAIGTGTNNVTIGYRPFFSFNRHFNGSIDEVRIWNVARTHCEIQQYRACEIPSTATGLVANYHFNQGLAASANTLVTLSDAAGANTGTLVNFALTGTTSNWVNPGGVTSGSSTPLSVSSVTASASRSVICTGESSILSVTGGGSYSWSNGSNGSSVTVLPASSTAYTVTNGCSQAVVQVSVSACTGVEAMDSFNAHVYPNPANDVVFVKLPQEGAMNVTLYSADGRMILNETANAELKIDIRTLSDGLYILKIEAGMQQNIIRIVKQ